MLYRVVIGIGIIAFKSIQIVLILLYDDGFCRGRKPRESVHARERERESVRVYLKGDLQLLGVEREEREEVGFSESVLPYRHFHC